MDIGAGALFFVIGMGVVLLARSFFNSLGRGEGTRGLQIRDGSVRMDHLVEGPHRGAQQGESSLEPAVSPELTANEEIAPSRPAKSRARRRKR
jgi:hypothetical protein